MSGGSNPAGFLGEVFEFAEALGFHLKAPWIDHHVGPDEGWILFEEVDRLILGFEGDEEEVGLGVADLELVGHALRLSALQT